MQDDQRPEALRPEPSNRIPDETLQEILATCKIVGYEVHDTECGRLSAELVQRCMLREQCLNRPLVLHSDNGAPMKASTMKAKLEELGVVSSHSRPRVSNDNAYIESLFRNLTVPCGPHRASTAWTRSVTG